LLIESLSGLWAISLSRLDAERHLKSACSHVTAAASTVRLTARSVASSGHHPQQIPTDSVFATGARGGHCVQPLASERRLLFIMPSFRGIRESTPRRLDDRPISCRGCRSSPGPCCSTGRHHRARPPASSQFASGCASRRILRRLAFSIPRIDLGSWSPVVHVG